MSQAAVKDAATPLMKQYEELKARFPHEILMFRLGDFYEIFAEDAKLASPILEVALTQRQGIPMCGVPHHALSRYAAKLLKKQMRIAIAEQMEDPALAKGIVKRDVIRVLTPGTILEENLLEERSNNFLAAVWQGENQQVGLAALDVSTGQFLAMEFKDGAHYPKLLSELSLLNPSEVLAEENISKHLSPYGFLIQKPDPESWADFNIETAFPKPQDQEKVSLLKEHPSAGMAVGMALAYVQRMNPNGIRLNAPRWMSANQSMAVDPVTLENLEVVKNRDLGETTHTLLEFLDQTLTAMGGRLLRQWLLRPLNSINEISMRHEAVQFLLENSSLRSAARESLRGALDLERICVRIATGNAGPRDVLGLGSSLSKIEKLLELFGKSKNAPELINPPALPKLLGKKLFEISDFTDLSALIERAIAQDPPIYMDNPGAIRNGYSQELDEKRDAAREGKRWLAELETRMREQTKITTLKVGYTSVFGYYFEVTKSHIAKVPPEWHRKQTLVNNERYINEELKTLEQKILGAEEQALRIEKELFKEVLEQIKTLIPQIQQTASAVSELDCLLSLAQVADLKGLAKPQMEDSEILDIRDGWHPVVKDHLPPGMFVANDCVLNGQDDQIMILTGPNMSGKSTYLRQTALTVLMAHAGSFVPAKSARIGLTDRILSRIGSGDKLAQGESTFMVEMKETAKILNDATSRSLVILDEVGRGTSTYDGISIAWAVIEHLNRPPKPKVIFATHYFELTHLASELPGVKNFNVQAKEWQDSVIFLHKIAPGPADRSYGIHVAKLAGLPDTVIDRAKKILQDLEKEHESLLQSRKHIQQEFTL